MNGHPTERLPNTLNIGFIGYEGHELLDKLNGVAASTGSACHSGMTTISPVLKAMGTDERAARGAVRFSLGRFSKQDEIDETIEKLSGIILNRGDDYGTANMLVVSGTFLGTRWNDFRIDILASGHRRGRLSDN